MDHRAQTYVGHLSGAACRFAVVASRFNELVVQRLLAGARDTLVRHGAAVEDIDVAWAPGAFEVPLVARRLAACGRYDAVVCVGAVVRGDTPHFDLVAGQAARGIAQAAWECDLPITLGVLTCDTMDQALDRAGGKAGNKGADAAMCALEMVQLMRALPPKGR